MLSIQKLCCLSALVTAKNRKSAVWTKPGNIVNRKGDGVEGFAACKLCKKVYLYNNHKTGTTGLRNHKCISGTQLSVRAMFSATVMQDATAIPSEPKKGKVDTAMCAVHCNGPFRGCVGRWTPEPHPYRCWRALWSGRCQVALSASNHCLKASQDDE